MKECCGAGWDRTPNLLMTNGFIYASNEGQNQHAYSQVIRAFKALFQNQWLLQGREKALLRITGWFGRQSQLLSSALSSACDFKSHFCKQCGPRSDCSFRCSLIRVHTVCLYAKIGLKSLQEYSADDINRRHFQMQFIYYIRTFFSQWTHCEKRVLLLWLDVLSSFIMTECFEIWTVSRLLLLTKIIHKGSVKIVWKTS